MNTKMNLSGLKGLKLNSFSPLTNMMKKIFIVVLGVAIFTGFGCKKQSSTDDTTSGYYGYGKIVVACAGKCHVSFGTADKLTDFDVEATTATYSFRYQTKYDLDIKITPVDKDQSLSLDVYSREEKQIFHNTVTKKVNEPWESIILVP